LSGSIGGTIAYFHVQMAHFARYFIANLDKVYGAISPSSATAALTTARFHTTFHRILV
jgi:hypothetical protein